MGTPRFDRLPVEFIERVCRRLVYGYHGSWRQSDTTSIGVSTVASLARTSRALHEPAVKVLWRWIPNLALLFYTLPRGCYRIVRTNDYQYITTLELTRQLEAADLARYWLYAERVTKVGMSEEDQTAGSGPFYSPRVLGLVASLNSIQELVRVAEVEGSRLLPNLTTMVIDEMLSGSQPHHFVSASLRNVHFEVYPPLRVYEVHAGPDAVLEAPVEGEEDITMMLTALRPIAQQLQKLDIDVMHPNSPSIVKALWGLVTTCDNLTSIRVDRGVLSITPDALRHIARLPFLQQLSFGSTDGAFTAQDIVEFDDLPPSETFRQLRAVDMTLIDLDLATTLITHLSSPFLQGLEIEISRTPPLHASIAGFLHSFHKLPHISALTWLHVRCDVHRRDPPGTVPDAITPKLLRPFLVSAHMASFEVVVGCPFDLDDAFIADMVHAWPDIDNLRLGGYYPRNLDYTPKVTWDGIITMARGWRNLKELSIQFDANISRLSPSKLKELRCSNKATGTRDRRTLEFMDVGLSKISDEVAVAALLSELFTPIGEINSSWNDIAEEEATEEQLRMEEEGDAFQPDPQLAARAALYAAYYHRWCQIEDPMTHVDLIRCQEENWRSATADAAVIVDGDGGGSGQVVGTTRSALN